MGASSFSGMRLRAGWKDLYHFTPWVTSLLNNHDHVVGYNKFGHDLKHIMQRLHSSVAKRVNDLLPELRSDFWRDIEGESFRRLYSRREAMPRGISLYADAGATT